MELRQREVVGHASQLLVLQPLAGPTEGSRLCQHLGLADEQAHPGLVGRGLGICGETGKVGHDAVDHDGTQRHADGVLQAVGRLDQLVDRRLLGEGDLRGCMVESSVGASLLARALEEGVSLETPVNTRWVVRPSSAVAPSEL